MSEYVTDSEAQTFTSHTSSFRVISLEEAAREFGIVPFSEDPHSGKDKQEATVSYKPLPLPGPSGFITLEEGSQLFGISSRQLRKAVKDQHILGERHGRLTFTTPAAILHYLENYPDRKYDPLPHKRRVKLKH